jgi:stalled ribosome rescue protein Dom34
MSARYHAIVWMNHNAAEVFRIDTGEDSKRVVNSHTSLQGLHHLGPADGGEHHAVDADYFTRIASALNHVGGILLAGPGQARFELGRFLGKTRPDLAAHMHELDIPGHPGDAALVALAREHFRLAG